MTMKKIILFISVGLLFALQACYDEYKLDHEFNATYFARQFPLRTLVDEGTDMTFDVGVVLGGKYENTVNEYVEFEVQDTLLNAYPDLVLLPENYYSIESNEIVIPSGKFKGAVTVTIDKEKFMDDPLAVDKKYALPLRITSASTDSVLQDKDYTIIVLRYYNKYHGWYWLKGTDYELDANRNRVGSAVYTAQDIVKTEDMLLATVAKDELFVPYIGRYYNDQNDYSMVMDIRDDGVCSLSGDATSDLTQVLGAGRYNHAEKTFTLEYNYIDAVGTTHEVFDTLYYRNTELIVEDWQ